VIDLSIRDTFLGAPFETPAGMIQQTHLAIGWQSAPARPGTGFFSPPPQWVARLAEAHRAGRLQTELTRLGRYPLLVIRRSRLHSFRSQSRQPVLPARLRRRAES